MRSSTALGAEKAIIFISDAHEKFYYEKLKEVRMAFNLYCNGTPSVFDYDDAEEQVDECRRYTVEELFCCAYAPYFWQAVQIRYPEYVTYNHNLYAMLGGRD